MRWDHEHAPPLLPDAPAAAQALQGTQAGPARSPSRLVPTLTDVLEVTAARPASTAGLAPAAAPAGLADAPAVGVVLRPGAPERPVGPPVDEELIQRVLAELQPQLDWWLQQRLGEVMGTAMARLGEALRDELRAELAPALHAMVARALAHELARGEGP